MWMPPCILWIADFCNSLANCIMAYWNLRLWRSQHSTLEKGQIIMFAEKASELHRAPIVPASGQQLAPNEQPAPIENLSTAKRAALIACLKGGGTLHKRYGVWVAEAAGPQDKPVAGITVADLSRDGMLTLRLLGKSASAQLTPRGSWFARTGASEIAAL
jgi:hypothetical protein